MNIVNLPSGSYQDCINIYNTIKKNESKNKKGLFIQGYLQDSLSHRQLKPKSMAFALGLTIFNGSNSVLANRKKNPNFNSFDNVYYCDYTKNKNTMFTNKIYKGSVYSLFYNN
jgi:5-methylthioribose kinase